MRIGLVDRIVEISPRERIVAAKNLSFVEGYLRDHFPSYPIMPGVLELETMVQAAQWLLRASFDFPETDFLTRSVANTRYSRYVRPGDQLVVTVELRSTSADQRLFGFKGQGQVGSERSVVATFELQRYEDTWARLTPARRADHSHSLRERFEALTHGPYAPFHSPGVAP